MSIRKRENTKMEGGKKMGEWVRVASWISLSCHVDAQKSNFIEDDDE